MAQSSSVKIGWIVMFIMGIYIAVLGLTWIFATEAMSARDFLLFAGERWSDFATNNPKPAEMMVMDARLTGVAFVVIGIVVAMMAWNAYSKAEKWAWYTALFAGILGWGSGIAYQITIASPSGVVLTMIGIALFLIGLVIPAKAILGKKSA
jgi:hypothetical protein